MELDAQASPGSKRCAQAQSARTVPPRHTRAPFERSPARRAPRPSRRSVRWNEDNLAHNEATKSATMKIDEPETPWASPPRELFDDEDVAGAPPGARHGAGAAQGAPPPAVSAAVLAASLGSHLDAVAGAASGAAPLGGGGGGGIAASDVMQWEQARAKRQTAAAALASGLSPAHVWAQESEGHGGGDASGAEPAAPTQGGGVNDEAALLRKRLFDAQRKALQGSYAGARARPAGGGHDEGDED